MTDHISEEYDKLMQAYYDCGAAQKRNSKRMVDGIISKFGTALFYIFKYLCPYFTNIFSSR